MVLCPRGCIRFYYYPETRGDSIELFTCFVTFTSPATSVTPLELEDLFDSLTWRRIFVSNGSTQFSEATLPESMNRNVTRDIHPNFIQGRFGRNPLGNVG